MLRAFEDLQFYIYRLTVTLAAFFIQYTAQKMNFSINDFFSKCDQISRNLRIWSHLLKKSLMENFIFCIVLGTLLFFRLYLHFNSCLKMKAGNYCGWLGQYGPCYSTNTWPSFLNTRPSFWVFLKGFECSE